MKEPRKTIEEASLKYHRHTAFAEKSAGQIQEQIVFIYDFVSALEIY
jgi:hypothetical protein